MKKVLLLLIMIAMIAGAVSYFMIRAGGGKYVKKAAEKTYEVGEGMDELKDELIKKEKKAIKKLDNIKKEINK